VGEFQAQAKAFVVWRVPSGPSVCLGEIAGNQRHSDGAGVVQLFAIGEISPHTNDAKICGFSVLPKDLKLHCSATMQRTTFPVSSLINPQIQSLIATYHTRAERAGADR